MRGLPDSIAGRTTLALVVGVVLILIVGTTASSLLLLGEDGPWRPGVLARRVETAVSVMDGLPAALRPDAASALGRRGLQVEWRPDPPEALGRPADRATLRIERRLQGLLRRAGARSVAVGQGDEPDSTMIQVELSDGSWLTFAAAGGLQGPNHLLRFLVMVAIIGGGLVLLAVWVARWVTAPLGRFAAAAAALGADVGAPPMSETGPAEIRKAAVAFNLMQRRIRRFLDERMQMLAAASHDLRTPITRLRLRAEFVEDEEQRQKMLKDLDEMEALIGAVLAFAREEAASEAAGPIDLAVLLRDVRSGLVETGHSVTVEGPEHLALRGRPIALKRAFANLIANAVTYGGYARVRLSAEEGRIVVTIDDGGPGIPEAEREKVFAPFYRLERSRSRETGGTGLGLSVARSVIRAHGGEIALSDRPDGGGLRQTVTLPVKPAGDRLTGSGCGDLRPA
mgnify:CR=1 FL=1|jgi:signal transduction histidine kinase